MLDTTRSALRSRRRPCNPQLFCIWILLRLQARLQIVRLTLFPSHCSELIPKVLEQVPAGKQKSDLYCDPRIRLDSSKCPGYTVPDGDAEAGKKGCRIRVVNADTFDTAIGMGRVASDTKGIVLLNMANARHPGGGWLRGTMAQEEELCYR